MVAKPLFSKPANPNENPKGSDKGRFNLLAVVHLFLVSFVELIRSKIVLFSLLFVIFVVDLFFIIVVVRLVVVVMIVISVCLIPGGSDDRVTRGASTSYLFITQGIIIMVSHLLILILNEIIISKIVVLDSCNATHP